MWFYVIASCIAFFSLYAIWQIFRAQKRENLSKQLDTSVYNHKMNTAKMLLKTNEALFQHYNILVEMYANEKVYGKNHRSKMITKITRMTADLEVAAAVCALAKIDASKQCEKKHVK